MQGYIILKRSSKTEELMKYPAGFMLLMLIAYRANRGEFNLKGLQQGEALLGDYETIGLSHRQYRTALEKLILFGFVTIKKTNRGTIAKLIDISIFDYNPIINDNQNVNLTTTNRQAGDNQATTNNNIYSNINNNIIYTDESVKEEKVEVTGASPTGSDTTPPSPVSTTALHPLQKYIKENCPTVALMNKQLTLKEAEELVKIFDRKLIKDKLEAMENRKDLLKTYSYVYKTLRSWCQKDVDKNKPEEPKRVKIRHLPPN